MLNTPKLVIFRLKYGLLEVGLAVKKWYELSTSGLLRHKSSDLLHLSPGLVAQALHDAVGSYLNPTVR